MTRTCFMAVVILGLALAGHGQAADAPATQPSALTGLEPYLGEWRIQANWSDGRPLDARAEYVWGLNRKFIIARTFVKQPDGSEYQRYESIFADVEGKLVLYAFTFDGTTDIRAAKMEGGRMSMEWKPHGSNVNLRQTTELTDAAHMRWHVEVQSEDGNWRTLMDGVWVKQPAKG